MDIWKQKTKIFVNILETESNRDVKILLTKVVRDEEILLKKVVKHSKQGLSLNKVYQFFMFIGMQKFY